MYCGINYKCSVSRSVSRYIACSRRSDSRARAKNKGSETAGKKRGETGEEDSSSSSVSPPFFPALSLALFFARALLSERLEQATRYIVHVLHEGIAFRV